MTDVQPFDTDADPPSVDLGERGPLIVVTAMSLSRAARDALAERMGPGHVVRDIRHAGNTADIVLVPSSSPQLIGMLRGMFPGARILVTELQDDEFGADFSGPVSTMAASGVDGYFVASSIDHLAAITYETGQGRRPIGALDAAPASPDRRALSMPPPEQATLSFRGPADLDSATADVNSVIIDVDAALAEMPSGTSPVVAQRISWSLARQLISQGISVQVITADDHQWWHDQAHEAGLDIA